MRIPFNPAMQLPKADYLAPIAPQEWHFRQSVDYSVTANKAVLDYASRHREQLLHNIWLMGKNAIDRGNRDSWTVTPKMVAAAKGDSRTPGRLREVLPRSRQARRTRLHHSRQSARLPHRDEVRQRPDRHRREGPPRDRRRSRSAARNTRPGRTS